MQVYFFYLDMFIFGWISYFFVYFEGFIIEIMFSFKLYLFVLNLMRGCYFDLLGILGVILFRIELICSFCSMFCYIIK